MRLFLFLLTVLMTGVQGACSGQLPREHPHPEDSSRIQEALQTLSSEGLLRHIRVLASDRYEGRAPGSEGEDLTVLYLTEQFRRLGLRPGNPNGTYIQNVPLAGITSETTAEFQRGGQVLKLKPKSDYIAVSRRYVTETKVERSELIFVGYGVVAPEYGWDDYKGVDVKGKTLVMLINDPPVPDPKNPSQLDPDTFRGKAMTYYGRWTYKYEMATEKGAAAAIIIHETGPAGYPFEVVSGSWGRENFDLRRGDRNMRRVAVESWVNIETAKTLFRMGGLNLETLKASATSRSFKPVPLGIKATFTVKNQLRDVDSRNVVARLEGSDPERKQEYVLYSAHWDHLGKDTKLQGDQIFNGALDNASGTASLLELAQAFSRLSTPTRRSILFLSVTAEEKGLLGAKYYAENPLYPLRRAVANINMDGVNQWGRTKDIVVVGLGNSTLDDVLTDVANGRSRTVKPDPEPEKGFYYRSDHFEFALKGVPALYVGSGTEYIGRSAEYGQQRRDEYTNRDYHRVSDEVKPDWNLLGAVEDLQLLFEVGYRVAEMERFPEWKAGTEFKARREEMLRHSD